jgi:hypothetical protein
MNESSLPVATTKNVQVSLGYSVSTYLNSRHKKSLKLTTNGDTATRWKNRSACGMSEMD